MKILCIFDIYIRRFDIVLQRSKMIDVQSVVEIIPTFEALIPSLKEEYAGDTIRLRKFLPEGKQNFTPDTFLFGGLE
jgi:hypothetical protein